MSTSLHRPLRALCCATLLLLAAVPAVAQKYTTSNSKAIKQYEKGREALFQSRGAEAVRHFEQALQTDSTFAEPAIMLAEWYVDAKDEARAATYYRTLLRHHPDFFVRAWVALGNIELRRGNNAEAEQLFASFLERRGTSPADRAEAEHGRACAKFRADAVAHPVDFRPENLGPNVNTAAGEYLPALTADGRTLVFTRRVPRRPSTTARTPEEEDFYQCTATPDGWSRAVRMSEPLNSNDNEGAQCISRDGRLMIFTACDRRDGAGRCDLYICTRHGDRWSRPLNMGPAINTSAWEAQPSLSVDGRTLYFVSNRKGGYGGMDIWRSTMSDGGWSQPENLGPTINTAGDESSPFIHFDDSTFYFASTGHVGMGGSDLFVSRRQADGSWSLPRNLGYPINTAADESGLIVHPDGHTAIYASDRLEGYGSQDLYSFELPVEVRPQAVVYRETLDTLLPTLEVGSTITLQNIFFATGSYALLEPSKVELDRLAEWLLKHPSVKVELGGHTDNVGRAESNLTLSQQRAKAVRDYLVQCGVEAGRLTSRGYGDTQPVASNDTEEGRAANRRTTFTLREK